MRRVCRPFAFATLMVAMVGLIGCSDSGDSDGDEASSPTTTAVATDPASRSVDTSFTGEGSSDFCRFLGTLASASDITSLLGASPADLEDQIEEGLEALRQAEAEAPSDIADDVTAVGDAFRALAAALSQAGYDVARVDVDGLEALLSDELVDGSTRLASYFDQYCGIDG